MLGFDCRKLLKAKYQLIKINGIAAQEVESLYEKKCKVTH